MAKLESLILCRKETKDVESWDIVFHLATRNTAEFIEKEGPNLNLELKVK